MLRRFWYDGGINSGDKGLPIMQIYARIYIKSKKKIVIVSKDGLNWQMPGGKPEIGETIFETLYREIYEETSIDIAKNKPLNNPLQFGYYHIEEDGIEYLQLRYFIELDDLSPKILKPNEPNSLDSINFVKMVSIKEIEIKIPWLHGSGEFNGFTKMINHGK